ncbi:tripartite tricarboxylate transporter TctB family protein [Hoeflea sp. TYP-13]|uniref:tripartite tricarboxylate transporter TctB family protein n=1 Tax=Hoeflea sp. TYP-13 TaxID=3230023 RepID=UPI0034C69112
MITPKQISWLITAFFVLVIAVVFQQIHTSMTEQGIASGGPYDNAAAYPRAVAVAIGVLVFIQVLIDNFGSGRTVREHLRTEEGTGTELSLLKRPTLLLVIFAIYLGALNTLGYHLSTAPMIFAIMWCCGSRQALRLVLVALVMSFVFAYIFEKFLNVVLPGGIFALNIPW